MKVIAINYQKNEAKSKINLAKGTLEQVALQPCPIFQGHHKWSLLACKLTNGIVRYCQFCYMEKLVPFAYNSLTEYYPAGTYYSR